MTENIKPTPQCPHCHTMDLRNDIKKCGPVYRRKTESSPVPEIQQYLCKKCGYKGRGKFFGLTEEMGKEMSEI